MKRTHTCGDLRKNNIDQKVTVSGWVQSSRDHGGLIFIDLRDRYGLTQIVFDPKHYKEGHTLAETFRREDVLQAEGTVRFRGEGLVNPKMATGEIEVLIDNVTVLNKAETPPIEVDDRKIPTEEIRIKYRYLDLRRPSMQQNIVQRHKTFQAIRETLNEEKFIEIETPMLLKHTPEGARDFIVPSRLHPGKVYSLPQSPQLYKQILMVSGFDRYYQLPICLRDEDLRQDRQLEFTQLDLEMSFVDEEDVYAIIEKVMKNIFKKLRDINLETPFQRLTYEEAMNTYGSDKPDLRFGMQLFDVSDAIKSSAFNVFTTIVEKSGKVKALNAEGCAEYSRKDIDSLIDFTTKEGAKGLAWTKIIDNKFESSIAKYFPEDVQKHIIEITKAKNGDLLLFVADKQQKANELLGKLRLHIADKEQLRNKDEFKLCWITDFPLFEWDEDNERWGPCHHIFTMPQEKYLDSLEAEPGMVRARLYDLAMNGVELGSGSIRIHRADVQERVLNVIGLSKEKANEKFGFLMEAFKYGAPPHGGIALGLDRIVALLCGTHDIREVIAFPKTKSGECLMDGSPSKPEATQLKELHIKFDLAKKE